jgi:enamine deaminase RidA (YjgF/YER057c/UK114 family)
MRRIDPPDIVKPASNYAQGIAHPLGAERLVISGQIGVAPDGTIETGMERQMERAWSNLFAVLSAAGFRKTDIVKITVFVTRPDAVATYRTIRDRVLEGHAAAATYLQVAGLAHPDLLVEIEAEAVRS